MASLIDISLGVAACAIVVGAVTVPLPRQKPEPPPIVCDLKQPQCKPEPVGQGKPVIVARPTEQNAQTKVDKIAKDLAETRKDLAEIKEALKAKQGEEGENSAR